MSSVFGDHLKLSIWGQSHGPAVGMTLDGIPSGIPVDFKALSEFLQRRAPGLNNYETPRKESDAPEFLSGIIDGHTCGAPICAVIRNENCNKSDYQNLTDCPRPGHADYTAQIKYHGFQDSSGGGHFSGRLTAPLCIAGGLCMQWLRLKNINIKAHIFSIGHIDDCPQSLDWVSPDLSKINTVFPVVNHDAGIEMIKLINEMQSQGDSIGGIIQCFITGIPAGLGSPIFGGAENRLSEILYGIPAVKGVEFGEGFGSCLLKGSENNDGYCISSNFIRTVTNHCGGILGGITNGMPVVFRVAVKPTPSIKKTQKSVSFAQMCDVNLQVQGRHDPCIVPRAVPAVEAAAAVAVMDMLLEGEFSWI